MSEISAEQQAPEQEFDALLDSGAVFGGKDSLVKDFEQQPARTPAPDGRVIGGTWSKVSFDIVLAPGRA